MSYEVVELIRLVQTFNEGSTVCFFETLCPLADDDGVIRYNSAAVVDLNQIDAFHGTDKLVRKLSDGKWNLVTLLKYWLGDNDQGSVP